MSFSNSKLSPSTSLQVVHFVRWHTRHIASHDVTPAGSNVCDILNLMRFRKWSTKRFIFKMTKIMWESLQIIRTSVLRYWDHKNNSTINNNNNNNCIINNNNSITNNNKSLCFLESCFMIAFSIGDVKSKRPHQLMWKVVKRWLQQQQYHFFRKALFKKNFDRKMKRPAKDISYISY